MNFFQPTCSPPRFPNLKAEWKVRAVLPMQQAFINVAYLVGWTHASAAREVPCSTLSFPFSLIRAPGSLHASLHL